MVSSADVRRRIGFFRTRVAHQRNRGAPDAAFGHEVVRAVQQARRAEQGADWDPGDGTLFTAWGMTRAGLPSLKMARVRLDGLPQRYRAGELVDLDLAANEGIADATHLSFFGDGIIGAEYNFHGPKASHLRHYLDAVAPDLQKIMVEPLLKQQAAEQFRRMRQQLTLVEIGIRRSSLDVLLEADDPNGNVFQTLRANTEIFGAERLHLTLSRPSDGGGRSFLPAFAMNLVQRLARHEPFLRAATTFRVEGFDPAEQEQSVLDLLSENLATTVRVARMNRNRVIVTNPMLDEIAGAHARLQVEIGLAASAAIGD